jgi:hypothetical protein
MDSFTESSVSWEGAKNLLLKKASEQRIGTQGGMVCQELLLQS